MHRRILSPPDPIQQEDSRCVLYWTLQDSIKIGRYCLDIIETGNFKDVGPTRLALGGLNVNLIPQIWVLQ